MDFSMHGTINGQVINRCIAWTLSAIITHSYKILAIQAIYWSRALVSIPHLCLGHAILPRRTGLSGCLLALDNLFPMKPRRIGTFRLHSRATHISKSIGKSSWWFVTSILHYSFSPKLGINDFDFTPPYSLNLCFITDLMLSKLSIRILL